MFLTLQLDYDMKQEDVLAYKQSSLCHRLFSRFYTLFPGTEVRPKQERSVCEP